MFPVLVSRGVRDGGEVEGDCLKFVVGKFNCGKMGCMSKEEIL